MTGTAVAQGTWPRAPAWLRTPVSYVRVLKPRETLLLSLIGVCSALVAGGGSPPMGAFLLATLAIVIGSGGTNGLTNYLDRKVDALMRRTRHRVLPAGLISPPEKALAWSAALVALALALAWYLHPYAFVAGTVGVTAALAGRKTWVTHFLGSLSSTGPVLVGWFAIRPELNGTILLLALLILVWVPVHVWNLMLAYRQDYLRAGVNIFPVNRSVALTRWLSFGLSLVLYAATVGVWAVGGFGWLYLACANLGGLLLAGGSWRLARAGERVSSLAVFRLSAYPFLGLIFLGLVLDLWLRGL